MNLHTFIQYTHFKPISIIDYNQEICGAYAGDLLSYVMGHSHKNQAWLTIMNHINCIGVASFKQLGCIVLCDGRTFSKEVMDIAQKEKINILYCDDPLFVACHRCPTIFNSSEKPV